MTPSCPDVCSPDALITTAVTFSSGLAYTVLVVEAVGVVMLLLTGWLLWRRRGGR
jgi:hypothetical protein